MKIEQIQAIGNLLSYYYHDLKYIEMFQEFKKDKVSSVDYIKRENYTFYSFLIEFKVIRNIEKGKVDKLLQETFDFINGDTPDDVDKFAERLSQTELTRGNLMSSLASKILFLNNPWRIIPMDTLTRYALRQKENKYSVYEFNLSRFRVDNDKIIKDCIEFIRPLKPDMESELIGKINDLESVCENRIIDKLLWSTRGLEN